jgi:Family of unknown function (DUF6533)
VYIPSTALALSSEHMFERLQLEGLLASLGKQLAGNVKLIMGNSHPYDLTALLYYDYLMTLPEEIEYVWKAPWRISTLLYVFCRYALVANLFFI